MHTRIIETSLLITYKKVRYFFTTFMIFGANVIFHVFTSIVRRSCKLLIQNWPFLRTSAIMKYNITSATVV
jgi:hypothetical protein